MATNRPYRRRAHGGRLLAFEISCKRTRMTADSRRNPSWTYLYRCCHRQKNTLPAHSSSRTTTSAASILTQQPRAHAGGQPPPHPTPSPPPPPHNISHPAAFLQKVQRSIAVRRLQQIRIPRNFLQRHPSVTAPSLLQLLPPFTSSLMPASLSDANPAASSFFSSRRDCRRRRHRRR